MQACWWCYNVKLSASNCGLQQRNLAAGTKQQGLPAARIQHSVYVTALTAAQPGDTHHVKYFLHALSNALTTRCSP